MGRDRGPTSGPGQVGAAAAVGPGDCPGRWGAGRGAGRYAPGSVRDACAAGLGSRLRPISTEQLVGVCLATGVVGAGLAWHFLLTVTWPEVTPWGLDEGVFNVMVDLGLIVAVLAAMVVVARLVFIETPPLLR